MLVVCVRFFIFIFIFVFVCIGNKSAGLVMLCVLQLVEALVGF